jgi:hypothetical protein
MGILYMLNISNHQASSVFYAFLCTFLMGFTWHRIAWPMETSLQSEQELCTILTEQILRAEEDIHNINDQVILPLPKGYEERKAAVMVPDPTDKTGISIKNYLEFQKFITQFAPPLEFQQALIDNEELITDSSYRYNKNQDAIFVKEMEVDRVINAARMKKIIETSNFKHIAPLDKYFFFIGDRFRVVTHKIQSVEWDNITASEIIELADCIVKTGYSDFDGINILKTTSGKWVFIDTEDYSFKACSYFDIEKSLRKLKNYLGAQNISLKVTSKKHIQKPLRYRNDLDEENFDTTSVLQYIRYMGYRRTKRCQLFGLDPFNQRTVEECINKLKNEIQQAENKLSLLAHYKITSKLQDFKE